MSDKPTPDDESVEDPDGEHTVIDSQWGDKFKEVEAKYAKDDAVVEEDQEILVTEESQAPSRSAILVDNDPNALTAMDFQINTDDVPTLDPASNPILPEEPSTMADRPLSKRVIDNAWGDADSGGSEPSAPVMAFPDDLVGPGFAGEPSDSFSDVDGGDDWGVTGHAQTGAWGVDETAFLHIDPTGDDQSGIKKVADPQASGDFVADPFKEVMGRIVCTAPGLESLNFDLILGELSVGRSQDCDITLDEPSVSRSHARLVVDTTGVRVIDSASNNGTFVNGRRTEEVVLKSRDEVSFGTVTTRFLAGLDEMLDQTDEAQVGHADEHAPTQRVWDVIRRHPYGLPVVMSGALILLTVLVALSVVVSRTDSRASDVKPDKVFQYFLDGIEAFKARQWDNAEEQFKILKGLDSSHTETLEYLDAIGEERRAENQMKLARTVRKQGHLKSAEEHARGAISSIYQQDVALEVIASIELEVDARLARARVSLEAGQFAESTRLLKELDKQYPGRSDVRSLLAFVEGLEPEGLGGKGEQARAASAQVQPSPEDAEQEALRPGIMGQAQNLFLEGNLDGALELLEQDGSELDAHMLAAQIHQFQTQLKVAQAEHRAKRSISALNALDSLMFLEGQIVSQPSMFRPEIDKKRADMHYLGGVEALGHQRYAVAARRFKRALAAVATYEKASQQLTNMVTRASELANQAQSTQADNPSEARKIWGDVLAMTPEKHPLHAQALRALKNR